MEYKFSTGQSFALQNLHNRRNQVKILDIHSPEKDEEQFNYTRTHGAGFSRADFARKFRKVPSASFICRYNDVERAVDPLHHVFS